MLKIFAVKTASADESCEKETSTVSYDHLTGNDEEIQDKITIVSKPQTFEFEVNETEKTVRLPCQVDHPR